MLILSRTCGGWPKGLPRTNTVKGKTRKELTATISCAGIPGQKEPVSSSKTGAGMVNAGFIVENEEEKSAYGRRVNASTDDFESLGYGDVDSISNMNYKQNFLSFYAEAGLRYWDRVSLDGRIYVEGSSNFGPKGRWGIYGGLNLGVDVLKLDKYDLGVNASWGRVGNNDIRGSYQHTLYYPTHYLAYGGLCIWEI